MTTSQKINLYTSHPIDVPFNFLYTTCVCMGDDIDVDDDDDDEHLYM